MEFAPCGQQVLTPAAEELKPRNIAAGGYTTVRRTPLPFLVFHF
jgi:hypothetical protein